MDFILQAVAGSCQCHFCWHGVSCANVHQDRSRLRGRGYQHWLLSVRKTSNMVSQNCCCQSLLPAPNMHRGEFGCTSWSDLWMRCESRGLLHQPWLICCVSWIDYENQPTSRSPSPLPPGSFSCPSQSCKLLWIIAVMFIQTMAAHLCLHGRSCDQ